MRAIDSHSQTDTNTNSLSAFSGDTTPPIFLNYVSGSTFATSESNIQLVFSKSTETDVSYYTILTRVTGLTTWNENQRVYQSSISGATATVNIGSLTGGTSYEVLVKVYDTAGNVSLSHVQHSIRRLLRLPE